MRVLVIEGQQQVRVEVHRALEKRACTVISAWDAQDVRGLLANHLEPVDVAVVDHTMVASDAEFLSALQSAFPAVRILLTVAEDFDGDVPAGLVLRKPVAASDLVRIVLELGA